MFNKKIKSIANLLTCSYEEFINLSYIHLFFSSNDLLDTLIMKKLFIDTWNKKLCCFPLKNKFKYKYKVLESSQDYIKIKLTITHSFIISNITSSSIEDFLIISDKNTLKLLFIVLKEETPSIYSYLLSNKYKTIPQNYFTSEKDKWLNNISSIDFFYDQFSKISSLNKKNPSIISRSDFDIDKACSYAEKFALNPNPNYENFEKNGGDCTNFTSQIINEGGIKRSSSWKPYSHSWIRVEELYNYLIYNKLGFKSPADSKLSKGMMIQFYTPSIGHYFHSGFITHELNNGDFLYCCHSYNKLNYPLSYIFPLIYPKLRAVYF